MTGVSRDEYEALLARVEKLESHQHSYTGPRDALASRWYTTGPSGARTTTTHTPTI